jgi:hypothetical protein
MLNFEVSIDGYTAKLTGDADLEGHYRSQVQKDYKISCSGCHFFSTDQDVCSESKCRHHQNVFGKEIIWLYEKPLTEPKESPKETLSKRHKHADLMIQYANDCTLPVWVRCAKNDPWLPSSMPNWYEDYEYAVGEKPKDAELMKYPNGTIEFYAPESKAPEKNTKVYYIDFNKVSTKTWNGSIWCEMALAKGIVHLTMGNAELHLEALVEFHAKLFNKEHSNY